MPLYAYTTRDKDGKAKQGVREGQSQEEILAGLQTAGLLVTQIKEVRELQKPKKKFSRRRRHKGVRINDLVLMTRQLATLVAAGVTLLRGIEVILQQVNSERLRRALETVGEDVRAGQPFFAALAKHPKIFSEFFVNLVRTGEAGGHLAQALEQLASHLENRAALQQKVVSAMIYPIILVTVSILIIAGFLFKIVPIFTDLFKSFAIELPPLTKCVIWMSDLLRHRFLFLVVFVGAGYFLFRLYVATEKGRWMWDSLTLKLPIVGELLRKIAVSNFAKGLGTLIKSGVPILYSLEIVEKTAGNKVVQRILEDVREEVREGRSIADPLSEGGIFDPVVIQMVRVGEEIGELGGMLEKVGKFYDDQIEVTTTRMVALIEPMAIIVMGVVVGLLVISMYMPIFNITQVGEKSL